MQLGINRGGRFLALLAVIGLLITTAAAGCVKWTGGAGDGGTDTEGLTTQPTGKVAVGAKAPDFTLLDADGQKFTLSSTVGQKVLLNFWRPT
jgi:cytochrome oxidase Cu insertion factor (SCO1/SenC/PrrC family)